MWGFYRVPVHQVPLKYGDPPSVQWQWKPNLPVSVAYCSCTLLPPVIRWAASLKCIDIAVWASENTHYAIQSAAGVGVLPEPEGWVEHRCDYDKLRPEGEGTFKSADRIGPEGESTEGEPRCGRAPNALRCVECMSDCVA